MSTGNRPKWWCERRKLRSISKHVFGHVVHGARTHTHAAQIDEVSFSMQFQLIYRFLDKFIMHVPYERFANIHPESNWLTSSNNKIHGGILALWFHAHLFRTPVRPAPQMSLWIICWQSQAFFSLVCTQLIGGATTN